MNKTLKTYSKKFDQFTVNLTAETRESSNTSNIRIWISLGKHLISMSSASSVSDINKVTAADRIEKEWKEFQKYENHLDYLAMMPK
jgi:hypothetical protein